MKIGLIGLGNMGGRIAKHLMKQGNELHLYDVNTELLEHFESIGAKIANSPKALASENKYVITVLPNAEIVKQVVSGEEGLITGFKPGSILIDMTSSIPEVTKNISKELEEQSVRMLDAPVSGGVKRAEKGTLTIMVGGNEEAFSEAFPIFDMIGSNTMHVGDSGAGHTIKALNNMISATTLSVTLEALAAGIKLGLDPYKMLKVINSSTGKSNSSENKVAQQVLSGKYEGGFTLDLMYKDLTTAMEITDHAKVPAAVSNSVYQLWEYASSQEHGNKVDHTVIAKIIEKIADVKF